MWPVVIENVKRSRSFFLFLCAWLLLIVSLLGGCAAPRQEGGSSGMVPLPEADQMAAMKSEADGDYLGAIGYWRKARGIVDARIADITLYLSEMAQHHARKGEAYFDKREGKKALKEFLEALRYDSANKVALDYLKNRYRARQLVPYTVAKGDTFGRIAENVYGNPHDVFAVMHFSGVAAESKLVAGEVINLPVLDSFYSQPLLNYRRKILLARNLFQEENYEELLPLAEKMLQEHPQDQEASYLLNSGLVKLADRLREQQRFEEAVGVLSRVDPAFRNVKKDILEIRELQKEKLAKDSAGLNRELFRKGELLYSQKAYPEALKVFGEVDPGFEGVDKAVANVRQVMKMQADLHYKQGVKYFVDDNLPAAIEEWEKTLRYEPDHQKAIDYITKSRQLLEKVESID